MTEKPLPSRLLLVILMGIAVVVLGWLVAGLVGDNRGRERLPGPNSKAEYTNVPAGSRSITDMAQPSTQWALREHFFRVMRAPRHDELWLRITLRNPHSTEMHGVLVNSVGYLDRATCYTPDENSPGGWRQHFSGEWIVPRDKPLWGRETAFPVTVPPHGEQTVYLQTEDYLSAYVDPRWWPEESAFQAWQMRRTLAEGLYFGTVLALLFYNAVLWARLRFPDTGPYLLYLVCFAGFLLVARGDVPLLGRAIGSPVMEMVLTSALALSGIFLMEFARRFLDLPARSPRAALTLRIVQWLLAALVAFVFLAPLFPMLFGLIWLWITASHLVLLWISLIAWRLGARALRYLVLMFGLVFSGLMPVVVTWLEIFPLDQSGVVVMTGSAVEMLLLSLAVAYRYSGIQREKIAAQQQLLVEAEHRRVLQEAYADELGLEVFERTRELQGAVADKDRMIAILAHDLCSPLTGLTRRAEQLAGAPDPAALESFARGTAAMGQQLLTLIGDLVSWAHTRGAITNVTPHPLRAVVEPMIALHREAAARRGISLEAILPEGVEVLTDLVQAQTLVRNLLSNAIKFATARVTVAIREVPGGVRISVSDDGPGLPAEVADGLSAEETDHFSSASGLGLRLCREIGRALGIRLHAAPVPGGGTEMSFILGLVENETPS